MSFIAKKYLLFVIGKKYSL